MLESHLRITSYRPSPSTSPTLASLALYEYAMPSGVVPPGGGTSGMFRNCRTAELAGSVNDPLAACSTSFRRGRTNQALSAARLTPVSLKLVVGVMGEALLFTAAAPLVER